MAAKILIIEDESALVVLLRYNLEAEGHEAVQELRRRRFGGKEKRPEHQRRGGPVNIEIIKFDRSADQARGQDAPMCPIRCQIHGPRPSPNCAGAL